METGDWDRCRCYRHCGAKSRSTGVGDSEERVIVLWTGRRYWGDRGLRFRSGFLINEGQSSKSTVRTLPRLGSSFLDNREWDSRWFHRPGAALPEFPPWVLGPDRTFGDSQSASSPGRACSRPAGLALGFCLAFGLFWMM